MGHKKTMRVGNSNSIKKNVSECLSPNPVYYRNPITFKKANEFNNGKRERPLALLGDSIHADSKNSRQQLDDTVDNRLVIHWFRGDLRVRDNTGLAYALNQSKSGSVEALYVINEHDWIAHMESGWKLKFQLDALRSLSRELAKLGVRLHVKYFIPESPCLSNSREYAQWFSHIIEEIAASKNYDGNSKDDTKDDTDADEPALKKRKKDNDENQKGGSPNILVTANLQYEVDELYRDLKICRLQTQSSNSANFTLKLFHDMCIIEPGILKTGKGSQYTIFTPWYKKWVSFLEANQKDKHTICIEASIPQSSNREKVNPEEIKYQLPDKFMSEMPEQTLNIPKADEETALKKLTEFISKRASKYNNDKDLLDLTGTSLLSCYVTSGVISARTILNQSYQANNSRLMNKDIKKNNSLETFIKEVAWRDFYKHAISYWPFLSMDLPFKFETLNIKWENDVFLFEKWCYGETGIPIVDAIMLKMLKTGYINNRSRMITASFLAKNLLIDWRWGERWFRKHLIDYDTASNVGGWGFCASTGIDCQPYFRVFNMKLQSEKYDPEGKFIRHWLENDENDSDNVHEPKPNAIVDLRDSRDRVLERFREVM